MSDPAVRVSGLTKRFPGVLAVDRLSFAVERGEIFGLVGPDGAGKTTTLRMLAGILLPDEGTAQLCGTDVGKDPEGVKNLISYMPQRFGLYEELTVEENIRFYADLFGLPPLARTERASRLLAASSMSEFGKRLAGQLSGGMKQKLGLTCALIHTPRVLLLDEPTTGVDPVSRRDFWRILYSLLAEGTTILISTAYLDEAERCHRLALLHQGRMLDSDTPARLKAKLPGSVVALTTPEPRRAKTALAGAEGILSSFLVGDGLHLVVDHAGRRIPELGRRLEAARLPLAKLSEIAPSIEDVFVAAVGGQTNREA
jgi:ABC-2 type transport system ATP-binding protein